MKTHIWLAVVLIGLAVASRLLPHPPNVAPITAVALFGAVFLPRIWSLLLPIGALLISDAIIGMYGGVMLFVYGSFLLSVVIGWWVRQQPSIQRLVISTLIASVSFYVITNFGVWLLSGMYSAGLDGLVASYVAGLPFFRNTLIGDIGYTFALFGVAYLAQMRPLARKTAVAIQP
jgi:hypothetical protein